MISPGHPAQFYIACFVSYVSSGITDGISPSITNKVLPLQLSRGIANSGLLVTLSGSFGRAIGGVLLGLSGLWWSTEGEYPLFVGLTAASGASVVVVISCYRYLVPIAQLDGY